MWPLLGTAESDLFFFFKLNFYKNKVHKKLQKKIIEYNRWIVFYYSEVKYFEQDYI